VRPEQRKGRHAGRSVRDLSPGPPVFVVRAPRPQGEDVLDLWRAHGARARRGRERGRFGAATAGPGRDPFGDGAGPARRAAHRGASPLLMTVLAIGIDVGGTKIEGLLVDIDRNGAILDRRVVETPTTDAEEITAAIVAVIRDLATG